MTRWLHIAPTAVADPYGFPALDAPGDNYYNWVTAASAYVASNTPQTFTGAGNVISVGDPSGTWQVGASYRYYHSAINANGLIAFSPFSEKLPFTLDSNDLTFALHDHPTNTFTTTGYWRTATGNAYNGFRWAPSSDRFYAAPYYAYRYYSWDGANSWNDWLPPVNPSSYQLKSGNMVYHDGYVFLPPRGQETPKWMRIDTSNDTMVEFLIHSTWSPPVHGESIVMGPGGCAYGFRQNEVWKVSLDTENQSTLVASTTNASWFCDTNPSIVDELSAPGVDAAGNMWVFPASRTSSGTTTSDYYAVKFDPATDTVTRFPLWNSGDAERFAPGPSGHTVRRPTLMPDGRFMIGAHYSRFMDQAGLTGYFANGYESYGPHVFDPVDGVWDTADRLPFGSGYTRQWGLNGNGVCGADGRFYPAPARIAGPGVQGNPLSYYGYGAVFGTVPDNPPPPGFYASPYKT